MSSYLVSILLSLGTGAVFAMLGIGLVLTYRGSGVINFSHGALGMYVTYVYVFLRERGDFIVPIPGLPKYIHVADRVAFWPAFLFSMAFAVFLGALVYLLVFRPLRRAPVLARVVASIGLLLTLQTLVQARFEDTSQQPPVTPILNQGTFRILGGNVGKDRLLLGLLAVVLTVLLSAVYRFTRFGLATRAAAENEKGATLLGFSPEATALVNWIMATVLAGVAGILVAPSIQLATVSYTFFVIPALGAALIGRFTSFSTTVVAAFAIGAAQALITQLASSGVHWVATVFGQDGMTDGLPFLVIIAVVALRGSTLPTRATLTEGRLPFAPRPAKWHLPAFVAFAAVVFFAFNDDINFTGGLVNTLTAAMLALSVVVLTGFVGQISLAQLSLAGVAGFALFQIGTRGHVPFPIAPLLAIALATILGVAIGIPALRVRGITLAIITLAAAYATERFVFQNSWVNGGIRGSEIQAPKVGSIDLSVSKEGAINRPAFTIFALVVLTLLGLAVVNVRCSITGQRMLAVRANERAAAAAGIDVARTKLVAFAISSAVAGTAGVMTGYKQINLSGGSYTTLLSITILAFAYLGGITTVSGALIAGYLAPGGVNSWFTIWLGEKQEKLQFLNKYELLFGAVGLITTAIVNPEGISGALIAKRRAKQARRVARRLELAGAVEGAAS